MGGGTVQRVARVETVVGTAGDDVLLGTGRVETIRGYGGDDLIKGKGGHDTLVGDGDDEVYGDAISFDRGRHGRDRIFGGDGQDYLLGDSVTTTAADPPGRADVIEGGNGDDDLYGKGGPDVVAGGPGNDFGDGGHGSDDCKSIETRAAAKAEGPRHTELSGDRELEPSGLGTDAIDPEAP